VWGDVAKYRVSAVRHDVVIIQIVTP